MEPSCLHQYTEPKSRNIMSGAIEQKIREAKEKYAQGEGVFNQEQEDSDLFKWLETCLERAKKRKYNDILVHLATIGKAMENRPTEDIELTLSKSEVRIAVFMAIAFEDPAAIWFLQDLTIDTLRKTKGREYKRILANLKTEKERPMKKQKTSEWEIDDEEFEKWLNGENEFLEGVEEV